MPRRIVTASLQSTGSGEADKFFDRVIKYIPADVVGGWVAVMGIIGPDEPGDKVDPTVLWVSFLAGLLLTALWTHRQTSESGKPLAVTQIVIATVAFAVWAFALPGPLAAALWDDPAYGSLLLIGFTLGIGAVVPKQ